MTEAFLVRSGNYIVNAAKRRAPVGRTGRLRRSIASRVKLDESRVEVGTWGVPYGAAQEFGGEIRHKNSSWLTIPTDVRFERRSPRKFDLVVSNVGGKKFLVDRGTGQAAYRLVKSVRLRPQPYLIPAFEDYLSRGAETILSQVMDELLQRAINKD